MRAEVKCNPGEFTYSVPAQLLEQDNILDFSAGGGVIESGVVLSFGLGLEITQGFTSLHSSDDLPASFPLSASATTMFCITIKTLTI